MNRKRRLNRRGRKKLAKAQLEATNFGSIAVARAAGGISAKKKNDSSLERFCALDILIDRRGSREMHASLVGDQPGPFSCLSQIRE